MLGTRFSGAIAVLLVLLFAGCAQVEKPKPPEAFSTFIAKYRTDAEFRHQRAAFPVKVLAYDEDGTVRQYDLTPEKLEHSVYKLYVDIDVVRQHHYVELTHELDMDKSEVLIGPVHSEPAIGYIFKRIDGEWFLISIMDYWGV